MTPRVAAALLMFVPLIGCQSSEKASGKLEDVVEVQVTVAAIDLPQRQLTLKDADGTEVVVVASEDVRNLDQIVAGDKVVVSYTESITWQVKPADQGSPGVSAAASAERAAPGHKPAGRIGQSVSLTASITAIDLEASTVTLTGPHGNSITLRPRDPANLKKAKVGDLIDITYNASLAIAVRPVPKA